MMSRGRTGRMMPKPIESTSTATKMNAKAPRPALRKLMRVFPQGRAILYEALRRLPAEQQYRSGGGAQRDLEQFHQVLCHGGHRCALEEQPLHEAQHVRERIDRRDELQPPGHVLHRRCESRQQCEWQQYRERAEESLLLGMRSEEHTSELQSRVDLVCRLLLE